MPGYAGAGAPGSHTMHRFPMSSFVTYVYSMSTADPPESARGPGRPRKWANDAERVQAYRQRKAEEQADVDALRVERRSLRRQVSDAVRGRQRAEAALQRERKRAEQLQDDLDRAQAQSLRAEAEIKRLRARVQELLDKKVRTRAVMPMENTLSRQQRRAIGRERRKQGR